MDRNDFCRMKEERQIYKTMPQILIFAWGLSYDLSKFSDDFTPFFRLWKTVTKCLGKNKKNLRQGFVAMNMMNKLAKFHKDSPSDKKLNSIFRAQSNFPRRPNLCTTLYRNLKQSNNFGGTFDQLFRAFEFFYEIFTEDASLLLHHGAKKVKNDQKLKSRGSCLNSW